MMRGQDRIWSEIDLFFNMSDSCGVPREQGNMHRSVYEKRVIENKEDTHVEKNEIK